MISFIKQFFAVWILLLSFHAVTLCQTNTEQSANLAADCKQFEYEQTNWKEIVFERSKFSFSIPKCFEQSKNRRGIAIPRFCHLELCINLDFDLAADNPAVERQFAKEYEYEEEVFPTTDGEAWRWSFKRDGFYSSGILFYPGRSKDYRIGIYLKSKDKRVQAFARKIFETVRLK